MNKEEKIYHTLPVIGVLLCFEFNKELMTLTATEYRSTLILNMDNPKSIVGRVIRLNDVRFVVQKVNVSEINKYNSEVKLHIVKIKSYCVLCGAMTDQLPTENCFSCGEPALKKIKFCK